MDSKYEYTEATHMYTTSFVRNSKAIGVLWGIFTICFAIINIVVFVQPQWLGDTSDSRGTGYFGLWKYCRLLQDGQELVCDGRLDDFNTIPSDAFRAATVFVGLSVIFVLLCICCLLLFFFFQSSTVFHICGWMQVFSAVCMIIGVLSYPAGWGAPEVREVCGSSVRPFHPGGCSVRWSFVLAIIACCDIVVLAVLAFVLGTRYIRLAPEPPYPSTVYKGEMNTGFVADNGSTTSRKSLNLQPVMLMPPGGDHDHYSEYSSSQLRTGRGSRPPSAYRPGPAPQYHHQHGGASVQNFQL